jgi:hypothetical protein
MTTLTLTPLPDLGAVRIEVAGAPAGALSIIRTDANGSREVRQAPDQVTSAGTLVLVDYEPALAGDVAYTADGAAASTTLDGLVAGPVVASVVRPARRADVQALVDYAETYPGTPSALHVIDRDDPIVLLGNAARRQAEAGLQVETYAQAQAVVESIRAGSVVMFRQVTYAGMDAYGVVTSTRVAPTLTDLDEPAWLVSIGYLAVPAPDDALAGAAAWTYQDVLDLGVTYVQLRALFATYYALAVGA